MITKATIKISQDELLSAIWYSDGSGHRGTSTGIEGTPDEWEITEIVRLKTQVRIELRRRGDDQED